jgi:hypothetical protein
VIIKPLRFAKPKRAALLVPGWRQLQVFTVDGERTARGAEGCYKLLQSVEDHVCYVASNLRGLVHTTGATHWTADVWRGRATTLYLDGTKLKVSSLRRTLSSLVEPSDQFSALNEVLEFLADQGVFAGSVSSMAWRLWRSTLSSPLNIGFDPKVSRQAFFGGRKGSSTPHAYRDQVAVDIAKAYPHAMVSRPYAGMMREVSRETVIDPEVSGLAKVRVTVPSDLRFPTLPVRLAPSMIQWRYGGIEGIYTWGEIDAARSVGSEIEVIRSWAPITEISPFDDWWVLMQYGYQTLSAGALKLFKSLGNLVWSNFAMTGDDAATIRWSDEYGEHPTMAAKQRKSMPQANTVHMAAETSSRVRVRMLLEGLYGDSEAPVHVDTDGIIVSMASYNRRVTGEGVGDWRPKTYMDLVEIKAPQLYRYTCGLQCGVSHSRFHYVAAGTPSRFAAELFDGKHPGFQISMEGLDTVVPTSRRLDEQQLRRYLIADEELQRAIYGPPLSIT